MRLNVYFEFTLRICIFIINKTGNRYQYLFSKHLFLDVDISSLDIYK